jgi:hypothetical protein
MVSEICKKNSVAVSVESAGGINTFAFTFKPAPKETHENPVA